MRSLSRRDVLKTSAAAVGSTVFAQPLKAAAPEAAPVTAALIEAARREGKLAFYTALELNISEKLGKAFEAKYPGIAVRVERSGAERIFQRIGQEQDSRINAVDLVCSTDPAHFIFWKRKDWVAPYVPEEAAKNLPRERIDPDGTSATVCAWFSVIGYNTDLVKPADAPKATPTCSIRNGRARSSRAIRATAVRSSPPPIRFRATSAGRISNSSRSRG